MVPKSSWWVFPFLMVNPHKLSWVFSPIQGLKNITFYFYDLPLNSWALDLLNIPSSCFKHGPPCAVPNCKWFDFSIWAPQPNFCRSKKTTMRCFKPKKSLSEFDPSLSKLDNSSYSQHFSSCTTAGPWPRLRPSSSWRSFFGTWGLFRNSRDSISF